MPDFLRPVPWHISYAEKLILKAKPKLKDDAEELSKQAGLLLRMHNLVVKHNLTACVRSVYDRAAFQSAKSNGKYMGSLFLHREIHHYGLSYQHLISSYLDSRLAPYFGSKRNAYK